MDINIRKIKGKPLYIQLYDAIVEEILSGRLRNGMKLPARRAMAEDLNISQTTVDGAYKMLQDTGYIISIPRRGYVVSFKTSLYGNDVPWENAAPEEIVFSPNGTDVSHLPRTSYAKILKDILYNYGTDIFSYPEKGGEFHFRNELSKYLYSCRDIKCSPSQIIVGAGAEYLLTSLSAIFPPDMGYILENPCDTHFYHALSSYGRKIVMLPINTDEFDADALYKSGGSVLCVETDTRFPRSESISPQICEAVLEWAYSAPDRYIVENGYDAELQAVKKKTIYSMDTENRVIYLSSFSRSISPTFKTAYMIIPEKLLELWKRKHVYYYSLVSKQEQYALAEFISRGYFAKHYKNMRKLYKERCGFLKDCLLDAFGSDIKFYGESASTYISAEFAPFGADEVKARARRAGVKLLSLNSYNVHKDIVPVENDRLIIGIGDLDNEKIRLGIRRLKACLT
ncbi:MAG: PLP-dependent aminotransferase family protein [Candidatus Ornithomonoglobus sp.]